MDRIAPTLPPPGRPAGFPARWRHLLFLHWEIADRRAPRRSCRLTLTNSTPSRDGPTSASSPFTMRDVRPWWSPERAGDLELPRARRPHLRSPAAAQTPGVWFFSLDAAKALAVSSRPGSAGTCPITTPRWISRSSKGFEEVPLPQRAALAGLVPARFEGALSRRRGDRRRRRGAGDLRALPGRALPAVRRRAASALQDRAGAPRALSAPPGRGDPRHEEASSPRPACPPPDGGAPHVL